MKISVDVDCTPEEARRFLGLPDLTEAHRIYVEKMTKAVSEAAAPEAFADMMKSWGPLNEAGMGLWRQMLDQMARKGSS